MDLAFHLASAPSKINILLESPGEMKSAQIYEYRTSLCSVVLCQANVFDFLQNYQEKKNTNVRLNFDKKAL